MKICFVIQVINFLQKCFCMFTFFVQGSFYTDTIWCQTIIRSIVNTKHLQPDWICIVYILYSIIEKFILSFQSIQNHALKYDQSFYFSMQNACPEFTVDLLGFRSLVGWALLIQHQNLRRNFKEMGKEAAGVISYMFRISLNFCVVFLLKVKQYNLKLLEMEFLSNTTSKFNTAMNFNLFYLFSG